MFLLLSTMPNLKFPPKIILVWSLRDLTWFFFLDLGKKKILRSMIYGEGNKINNRPAENCVFMTFLLHLLMENCTYCLYPTPAMLTVSSVSVGKQPDADPAPPGPVSTEMTEPMAHGNMPLVEDASSTTSWRSDRLCLWLCWGLHATGMLHLESWRQSWAQSYSAGHGLSRWRTVPQQWGECPSVGLQGQKATPSPAWC